MLREHFPYAVAALTAALIGAEHYAVAIMLAALAIGLLPVVYGQGAKDLSKEHLHDDE